MDKKAIMGILIFALCAAVVFAGGEQETAEEGGRERVTFTYVAQDRQASAPGDEAVREYINQRFNVDYRRVDVPAANVEEKLSIMLASGETMDAWNGDIYGAAPYDFPPAYSNDVIQPLGDYLDATGQNLVEAVDDRYWDLMKRDGLIYGVPELGFASKVFLFVRADWMEDLGLETPTTIEEFEDVLRAIKGSAEYGGPNRYPLTAEPIFLRWGFAGSFLPTGENDYIDEDGNLAPYFTHPNFKTYMETLRRWHEDGLMHPDIAILKRDQVADHLINGTSGVHPNWYTLAYEDRIQAADPDGDVEFIPFPVGPSGTSGAHAQPVARSAFMIHARTEPTVAERIIEIVDWMQTPEGTNFAWNGVPDEHWELTDEGLIAPAEPYTSDEPAYRAQLYINAGDSWENFTPPVTWPAMWREAFDAAISGDYPAITYPTYEMPISMVDTEAEQFQQTLDRMTEEMFVRVLVGDEPIDYIDQFIEDWYDAGGDVLMAERNRQYRELTN